MVQNKDLVTKVHVLESNHLSFVSELKQTNETLRKIETAIEKQNEISTDIRLLRQEFKAHADLENESTKRQNARIEKVESNQGRVAWIIISAVVVALLGLIIKG